MRVNATTLRATPPEHVDECNCDFSPSRPGSQFLSIRQLGDYRVVANPLTSPVPWYPMAPHSGSSSESQTTQREDNHEEKHDMVFTRGGFVGECCLVASQQHRSRAGGNCLGAKMVAGAKDEQS